MPRDFLVSKEVKTAVAIALYRRHLFSSLKGWSISVLVSSFVWALTGFGDFWPAWIVLSGFISVLISLFKLRRVRFHGVVIPDSIIEVELNNLIN